MPSHTYHETRFLLLAAFLLAACTPDQSTAPLPATPAKGSVPARGVTANAGITTLDLGTLAGGGESRAYAINQLGTATGFATDGAGNIRLVRWKRGGDIEDLGQAGTLPTYGLGIDDAEEIVGGVGGKPSHASVLLIRRPGTRAFYWNGVTGFVTLPGQGPSIAYGVQRINNGTATRIVGCDAGRLALWTGNGTSFTITTPALPNAWQSDSACATAVNRRAQYVGVETSPDVVVENYLPFAFSTQSGFGLLSFQPAGTWYNAAYGQSETPRRIVGEADNAAILWPSPTQSAIHLTQYNTHGSATALGVNNRTEVVGYLYRGGAFFWTSEVGLLYLPPAAAQFPYTEAYAINDSGEVVGASLSGLSPATATLWLPRDTAIVSVVKQLPIDTTTHLPPKVSYIPRKFINDGILSRPGFDATRLDPNLVTLGDGLGHATPVARTPSGALMYAIADVDGDGDLDLSVSFSKAQLIADGVLTPTSYQFELTFVDVTGLPVQARYPIWVP